MLNKKTMFLPLIIFAFVLTIQGCSVKMVADYDDTTKESILKTAKEIDKFYCALLETEESKRQYEQFSKDYHSIEVEIRSLVLRNKARPLNKESTKQAEIALDRWIIFKERHKTKNTYSTGDAKLDRDYLSNIFNYMLGAELAKKEAGETKK